MRLDTSQTKNDLTLLKFVGSCISRIASVTCVAIFKRLSRMTWQKNQSSQCLIYTFEPQIHVYVNYEFRDSVDIAEVFFLKPGVGHDDVRVYLCKLAFHSRK